MQTKTKMNLPTAVILADHSLSGSLKTVFGDSDTSSLMIAGFSILDHCLMELQDLGFEQCIILATHNAKQLQARFGRTNRWGMTITIIDVALSREQVLREYKSLSEPNGMLVIEMDRLRSHCVKSYLEKCDESEYSLLEGITNNKRLGLTLLKNTDADFIINTHCIDLDDVTINRINDCQDFHRANFDIVDGVYNGLEPSVQHNSQTGLRQHWASHVHKRTKLVPDHNMIERHCQLGSRASLDSVILNHDVYIESRTKLKNTVVMPNAIISNQIPIKDAIINEGRVYQIN